MTVVTVVTVLALDRTLVVTEPPPILADAVAPMIVATLMPLLIRTFPVAVVEAEPMVVCESAELSPLVVTVVAPPVVVVVTPHPETWMVCVFFLCSFSVPFCLFCFTKARWQKKGRGR